MNIKTIYCSFDLMLLENNKVYNRYDIFTGDVELNLHRINLNFDSFSEYSKKIILMKIINH